MPLNEVGFHLAHGIKHDAHNDQQAGAAKKLRCNDGHIQPLAEETWKDRDHRQETRASKRESRHREIKKVGSRFSWAHTRNVTAVFFKVVRDLSRLKLRGNPEVTEKENHCRKNNIMEPACRKRCGDARGCRAVSESVLNNG